MHEFLMASLIVPWLAALALALLPRHHDRLSPLLGTAGALLSALLVSAFHLGGGGMDEGLWLVDGLSSLFMLLTAWIHVLVTVFSWRYLPHAQHEAGSQRRDAALYGLLNAFNGSMLGLVSAGHLVLLYFFWELTGIASFLLIGYWHHGAAAREGALKSLVLTLAGGVGMLLGFLGLNVVAGTMTLSELLAGRQSWQHEASLVAIAALIVVGAMAKSAQVPFSGWLPAAMAAPTPVSAFLHSAALVAAGVYLLARFFPLLSHTPSWYWILVLSGVVGGLSAGLMALRQTEMKALLAYSTVSQYAFIFLAFGLGTTTGSQAALYAFLVHAFIKAGLFLVSGAVTSLTDETRFEALGGLGRTNPLLATMGAVLALSLGGVPLLGGFYYKEELLYAAYDQQAWLLLGAMLVGGMLTFLYMLRFLFGIFGGQARAKAPGPLSGVMGLVIGILAIVSVLSGLAPNWMNQAILDPALSVVTQEPVRFRVELKLGVILFSSLSVLAAGMGLWVLWRKELLPAGWGAYLPERFDFGGKLGLSLYDAASDRVLALHSGNLRSYLRWELMAGLGLVAIFWWGIRWGPGRLAEFDLAQALMIGISLLAASATIWLRLHVMAVIALTISGYALAVVFALMDAPDVALAQVLVETLATFSIVMALRQSRLIHPERTRILTAGRKDWGRWGISLGFGGAVGWLAYEVGRGLPEGSLGALYAASGHELSGMSDLVTAILADFRALDTAVEILVFASAAFAVIGLFPRRRV